ncbi:MAG: hypothetical protein IPK32_11120 [Verrucomicrobiaceae bacterium]|nr:hypothetical protein [Verrucomicrobiaceae bacterium]
MKLSSIRFGMTLAMTSTALQAGTITLSSVGGAKFTTKNGTALPAGCAVRLGTFSLPDETRDAVLNSQGDYAWLKSVFSPLAEGFVGAGACRPGGWSRLRAACEWLPCCGGSLWLDHEHQRGVFATGHAAVCGVFNHADPDQATQWGLYTAPEWTAPPELGNRTLNTGASVSTLQVAPPRGSSASSMCQRRMGTGLGRITRSMPLPL